ncbi:hypothetical protein acdb102_30610 [Acidothermaceae bacterium B102]|nr:hypothetical protein acdb102_30610 [Acidothermaceae bacterium B102]
MTARESAWPEERRSPEASGLQVRRWGLRLLAFLAMAFVAVVASSIQQHYTVLTSLLLVVGLPGAAVCTVGGLKAMYDVPPDQRARGHSRR